MQKVEGDLRTALADFLERMSTFYKRQGLIPTIDLLVEDLRNVDDHVTSSE